MAYAFLAGSLQYLSTTAAPASGTPMTMACWMRPTNFGTVAMACGVRDGTNRNQIGTSSAGGNPVNISQVGATATVSATAGAMTSGEWAHVAGVFTSATSRRAFYNGTGGTTVTTNAGSQAAFDAVSIGARWSTTLGLYLSGDVAECGIWDVALSVDEIASLAKGFACYKIRPQSLVFYAPLVRNLIDVKGGLTITNNNTATVAAHTRVYA